MGDPLFLMQAQRYYVQSKIVRIFALWWTRRESNPCPKSDPREYLRVQSVYNISFAAGRQTGRGIGSFMGSWPPAKLRAAHVQCLNDALAPHGT